MRLVNELTIRGEPSQLDELSRRIEQRPEDRWLRERASEDRLRMMKLAPIGSDYCFSKRDDAGRPVASLWLHRKGAGEYFVSNIMAEERRNLTDAQYNEILADFELDVLRPLTQNLKIEPRINPPGVKLEENLSVEAITALRSFSASANKTELHPLDSRRWGRFLIRAHLDGPALDGPDLDWWLREQGWPEEQRRRLVESYETGLSLLAEYDDERVAS